MSLLRLLSSGKSLVGLKESEHRYRVTNQRLLPKFEKKNAFVARLEAPPAEEPASPASTPSDETKLEEAPAPAPVEVKIQAVKAVSESETALARVWRRLGGGWVGRFGRSGEVPRRATRQHAPRRMLQAELSLDTVKVVRNDLIDSDVEIVMPKKAVPTQEAAEAGWAKVTDCLFGSAKR